MNILYSGDSWTWGGELDGLDKNHGYRIANRFSSVVGHPHVNIGSNGWSNEMISRSVVDYIESNENTAILSEDFPSIFYKIFNFIFIRPCKVFVFVNIIWF